MASEIRANKQTNRAGLGTVTYTDTGIVVSGIVTATQFEGSLASTPGCLLYTSPSPRDVEESRMPSSA